MSVTDYAPPLHRSPPVDLDTEHRRRIAKQDQFLAVERLPPEPILEPVAVHVNLRKLEQELTSDPEREHAAAFLRLTYGVVMSMCRRIEGKPQNGDYDEGVAKLAEKMYHAAMAKVAE